MKYVSFTYHIKTIVFIPLFFMLISLSGESTAQTTLLDDKETFRLILQALDSTYDQNFSAAEQLTREIGKRIPDHPGYFLLKAFIIEQKNMPLRSGTAAYDQFEALLHRTIEDSEMLLDKNKDDIEGIFFSLVGHGYLAQLYADNNKFLKAAGEAMDAYDFIKQGFDLTRTFPDFYFTGGLYNYFREAYPELYPYYKTMVWMFRTGDKKTGIEMLIKGSETALFTRTENLVYLGQIFLRYENNPEASLKYTEKLIRLYPHNLMYQTLYVENLLTLKKCYRACPHIDQLRKSDKAYYRYIGEIFYGNYLEATLSDLSGALNAYRIAEGIGDEKNVHDPHFDSMLYLGLGRINKKMGNVETARGFFYKALETAVYPAQKAEARSYLD